MQNSGRISAFICVTVRSTLAVLLISIPLTIGASAPASAQEASQSMEAPAVAVVPVVPQQVRYAGRLASRAGETVEAEFRIYAAAEGGEPLWTETQHVTVGEDGSYSVLLGSANPAGLPQSVFAGGAARWLCIGVERAPEQERVLLSSVPYAMKSADAESLAGHAASDFVTQEQFAQLAQSAQTGSAAPAITPFDVAGSGTAGTVPLWTGASAQGNSEITQVGSDIGINEATPAATLDVNGTAQFRGTLTLPANATATSSSSYYSQFLNFSASVWSSTTKAPITPSFVLFAYPENNNTANPSAKFYMQYREGSTKTNLFSVNSEGIIGFAAGQTFPGTITSVSATSPVTAATTSGAVSLGLNTAALEATLNTLYPQLGIGNVFKSYIQAIQYGGPLTAAVTGAGTNESTGAFGASDTGLGVYGNVVTPKDGESAVLGSTGKAFTFSNTYAKLGTLVNNHVAGMWGDTTGNPNPGQYEKATGVLGTADNAYAGAFYNNSSTVEALHVQALGKSNAIEGLATVGNAVEGDATGGVGVLGRATNGDGLYASADTGWAVVAESGSIGVYAVSNGTNTPGTGQDGVWGITSTPAAGTAGIFGTAFELSNTHATLVTDDYVAGAWGDTSVVTDGITRPTVGVIGSADNNYAGLFINNSATYETLAVENLASGPTGLFKTLKATTAHGVCGIGGGGNLTCSGQVKTLATTGGGARTVETYSTQSAENWMEDYGSGTLENGVGVVKIDPTFAETVSETADYHVFLTPNADSKGLYVINKTRTSFEVRESGGGTSTLMFDYKIVAKRRGFESQRLVDVTERYKAETKSIIPARADSAPVNQAPQTPPARPNIHVAPRLQTAPGSIKQQAELQKRPANQP
jgi:hypothetical protein